MTEKCQTPLGMPRMGRRRPESSSHCFLQPSLGLSLMPQSPNPPTPQRTGRARTQKQQVQSHQTDCTLPERPPSSLTAMHHDDKGLLSFLSFQLPSRHPLPSVFPACDLPRSRRVDGHVSGPRGEMKEAKIRYPPASSS